jgi:hypothetical protein
MVTAAVGVGLEPGAWLDDEGGPCAAPVGTAVRAALAVSVGIGARAGNSRLAAEPSGEGDGHGLALARLEGVGVHAAPAVVRYAEIAST